LATVDAIGQLHTELQDNAGERPISTILPRRLTDFLLLDYLNRARPQVHAGLLLLGLIEHEPNPPVARPHERSTGIASRSSSAAPGQIAEDVYRWNSGFDATAFLARLAELMKASGLPGACIPSGFDEGGAWQHFDGSDRVALPHLPEGLYAATYSQFGITFSPADAQRGGQKGIALLPYIMGAADFQFDVCDRGQLVFQSSADIKGVGVVVRPPFDAQAILSAAGDFSASVLIQEKPTMRRKISSSVRPVVRACPWRGWASRGSPKRPAASWT